jgi:uncharacterized protein (DUF2252 family)
MSAVYERILAFNQGLLPQMLELKYKAMAESPFRFFRGSCHLFYEDLSAATPLPPSPLTWACGDLHIENFGSYKADNRMVYFDLNDFDESILAPDNWEVARMVTSIFVAFSSLKIERKEAMQMARLFLKSYAGTLQKAKSISFDPRTAKGIVCSFLTKVSERKQKELLKKRTSLKKHKLVLEIDNERQFELEKPLKKELAHTIDEWMGNKKARLDNFKVLDSCFRIAGTGSVGLKRYLLLLQSKDAKEKYLFLDMKQARASSLAPYVKAPQPLWKNEAERVITLQERMQNVSPKLLSSLIFKDEAYVVKEMQPMDDAIDFEMISDRDHEIYQVVEDMAILTASAQLRSSGRQGSAIADELIAYAEDPKWQDAIIKYAVDYATTVKKDYQSFVKEYNKRK